EEGKGSTFTVSLRAGHAHLPSDRVRAHRATTPVATRAAAHVQEAMNWITDMPGKSHASPPPTARNSQTASDARVARPRVLWADDNPDMRDYVYRLLTQHYDVTA